MHRFRLRLDAKPAELTLVIALREFVADLAQGVPAILPKDLEREVSRHTSETADGDEAVRLLFPQGLHGWDIAVVGSDLFIIDDGDAGNIRTVALILQYFAPSALPCSVTYTDVAGSVDMLIIGPASRVMH